MKQKNIVIVVVLVLVLALVTYFKPEDKFGDFEHPFPLLGSETVDSWDFVGIYSDGGELETKAGDEIERLKGLFNDEDYSDYQLYISLAFQYDLLGNGEKVYEHLGRALVIDSEKTGLAWHNMGRLMASIRAYESAKVAFDRAILAQPLPVYYMSQVDFLENHFPENKEEIRQIKLELGAN